MYIRFVSKALRLGSLRKEEQEQRGNWGGGLQYTVTVKKKSKGKRRGRTRDQDKRKLTKSNSRKLLNYIHIWRASSSSIPGKYASSSYKFEMFREFFWAHEFSKCFQWSVQFQKPFGVRNYWAGKKPFDMSLVQWRRTGSQFRVNQGFAAIMRGGRLCFDLLTIFSSLTANRQLIYCKSQLI